MAPAALNPRPPQTNDPSVEAELARFRSELEAKHLNPSYIKNQLSARKCQILIARLIGMSPKSSSALRLPLPNSAGPQMPRFLPAPLFHPPKSSPRNSIIKIFASSEQPPAPARSVISTGSDGPRKNAHRLTILLRKGRSGSGGSSNMNRGPGG